LLVAVVRENYCWLVADKPSEQAERINLKCSSAQIDHKDDAHLSV
jgi:hypothetical protein